MRLDDLFKGHAIDKRAYPFSARRHTQCLSFAVLATFSQSPRNATAFPASVTPYKTSLMLTEISVNQRRISSRPQQRFCGSTHFLSLLLRGRGGAARWRRCWLWSFRRRRRSDAITRPDLGASDRADQFATHRRLRPDLGRAAFLPPSVEQLEQMRWSKRAARQVRLAASWSFPSLPLRLSPDLDQ